MSIPKEPRQLMINLMYTQTGRATITVSGGDLIPTSQTYRVKRIPNPVMKLGDKTSGSMSVTEFRAHQGIIPMLENFDFEAKCVVTGFELTRQLKNSDVLVEQNKGGRYGAAAQRLVHQATAGDIYYFGNIRVRCPGDSHTRTMDEMIFRIK